MEELQINVGCGVHSPKSWTNLDSSYRIWLDRIPLLPAIGYRRRFAPWVRRCDVKDGLPFRDMSASLIYSSHMIEHLTYSVAEFFVRECARVLRPGGRLRLMTPNLHYMVENYLGRRSDPELQASAAGHFFRVLGVVEDDATSVPLFRKIVGAVQRKNVHQWLYDEYSLTSLLESAGFQNIQVKHNWRSDFPDLDLLEPSNLCKGSVCAEARR